MFTLSKSQQNKEDECHQIKLSQSSMHISVSWYPSTINHVPLPRSSHAMASFPNFPSINIKAELQRVKSEQ
jgi:hypothetical protein